MTFDLLSCFVQKAGLTILASHGFTATGMIIRIDVPEPE